MTLRKRAEQWTVASALAARATADPAAPYVVSGPDVHGYGRVDTEAEALAAALAHLGVEAGDRIALVLPPRPEFATALFAAAKLGAGVVPLSPRMTAPELQYMLRHSEAVCAVTIEELEGRDYLQLFESIMPRLPELQYLVTVGEEDLWYDDRIFQFEDLLSAGAGRDFEGAMVDPASPFALVYTSGTMGKPKGVELSHRNLLATAAATAERLGLGAEDRVVGLTALFHVFGLVPGLLSTLLTGGAVILHDERDAAAALNAVERHAATVHYGVPATFVTELAQMEVRPRDLSSLRLCVVAGAPVSDELLQRVERGFGVPAVSAYSLTENASVVAVCAPDAPPEARRFTVGPPLEGTEVRITDEAGVVLPVESVGEIGIRGPGVMLGYHRQPGDTAVAFDSDGFFRTGDLGLVDEAGQVHLVGRRKDVIIRSGFNVYPREVESRIEAHPAVQEVAVVGIPDPLLGEAVCACVVPVEGALVTGREIVEWCRETLAEDKLPDVVRFLETLPRTETGQIRRAELARAAEAESAST